jgi:hypothetical protein
LMVIGFSLTVSFSGRVTGTFARMRNAEAVHEQYGARDMADSGCRRSKVQRRLAKCGS